MKRTYENEIARAMTVIRNNFNSNCELPDTLEVRNAIDFLMKVIDTDRGQRVIGRNKSAVIYATGRAFYAMYPLTLWKRFKRFIGRNQLEILAAFAGAGIGIILGRIIVTVAESIILK